MGEGREGDWDCGSCQNRNYAFRSFCNRCKQPRLLVGKKTAADSKWLPRIGDWICSGCTNNNYASRDKCKKCGQPKEVAAIPAIAMAGAMMPTHAYYFARTQGEQGLSMNPGLNVNPSHQALSAAPGWPLNTSNNYGLQASSSWSYGGNSSINGYLNNTNQFPVVPNGWRNGDWLCNCGFHNYSSRVQCKKCNAPFPSTLPSPANVSAATTPFPALGTKRLASEEFGMGLESKRLNAGDTSNHILINGQQVPYGSLAQTSAANDDLTSSLYALLTAGTPGAVSYMHNVQSQQMVSMPSFMGKGAKHWRNGDWMCTNCNNHNYSSRLQCNRCNTQRSSADQSGTEHIINAL